MKRQMNWIGMACSLLLMATLTQSALAASPAEPDAAIRAATENLLQVVEHAHAYFDSDPDRYYAEVDAAIAPVIDFYSFSRGVMGRWGSKAYSDSLGPAEKKRYQDQVGRFVRAFREGLVRTYSKGLMAFSGETVEVYPAQPEEIATGLVTVVQVIHGSNGNRYEIRYKMRKDPDQSWRVRNVTLDTLNLGKVYQNQFASAAGKFGGDIDAVIDNWSVVPESGQKQ
ncbi:MAG: ABC transporter substrate-binding protein [Pseudomonadales bacterium]|nr:ABC transporter substrate-binding protein [Pseudomonadales bacterium]